MMKSTVPAMAMLLLGVASSSAMAGKPTGTEPQTMGAVTQAAAPSLKPVTETLRGVIDSVDERNDIVGIRLSPQITQQFRVQDGLVFNSVRYGDRVEVTVQDISGAKTIVGLKNQ